MYNPKRKHNILRNSLIGAGTAIAVGAAAIFAFGDSEPEAEVIKPNIVKVTHGQDGRTYLEGCFKRFNKLEPAFDGANTDYNEGSKYGTLSHTTTNGDTWGLMFYSANRQGRDTNVPMSQLSKLETYDTQGQTYVKSDEHNGKVYYTACRQLLPGVELDQRLYGQFLAIDYDGEGVKSNGDVPYYRGHPETGMGPLNGTTTLAQQSPNSPTRVHVTTIDFEGKSLQIPVQQPIDLTSYRPVVVPG